MQKETPETDVQLRDNLLTQLDRAESRDKALQIIAELRSLGVKKFTALKLTETGQRQEVVRDIDNIEDQLKSPKATAIFKMSNYSQVVDYLAESGFSAITQGILKREWTNLHSQETYTTRIFFE